MRVPFILRCLFFNFIICQFQFLFFVPSSLASVGGAVQVGNASPFYRNPQSLFPSGQANPLDLERKKIREFQEIVLTVTKDGRTYRLPDSALVRDLDLSARVAHASSGQTGTLIGNRGPWMYVLNDKTAAKEWWSIHETLPLPDDLGFALPLTDVPLRRGPGWKEETLSEIKAGSKLRIRSFSDQWVKVAPATHPHQVGWVELGALVMKFDFATFVLPRQGHWTPVRYRQGSYLVTGANDQINLQEIQAVMTRPDLAIVADDSRVQTLHLRNLVNIQKWEYIIWAVSRLPGHGEIFWKTNIPGAEAQGEDVSFEEILKKPVYSVAFNTHNPQSGLISADGVFRTDDGLLWHRIPQFHEENVPVAIGKNEEVFAGFFRSTDGGKTFLPYVRWEDLAQLLQNDSHQPARILRLVRILPQSSHQVDIQVDNGVQVYWFRGSTRFGLVTHWMRL
ncbi:MAG: hypothetical protein C5B49_06375 [Bdellovibrio sp.]|nr:MAG: hypothetical protein C5B49_06375 [Bdellovibrio sp.]